MDDETKRWGLSLESLAAGHYFTRLDQCFALPGGPTVGDIIDRDGLERVRICPPASLLLPPDPEERVAAVRRLRPEYLAP